MLGRTFCWIRYILSLHIFSPSGRKDPKSNFLQYYNLLSLGGQGERMEASYIAIFVAERFWFWAKIMKDEEGVYEIYVDEFWIICSRNQKRAGERLLYKRSPGNGLADLGDSGLLQLLPCMFLSAFRVSCFMSHVSRLGRYARGQTCVRHLHTNAPIALRPNCFLSWRIFVGGRQLGQSTFIITSRTFYKNTGWFRRGLTQLPLVRENVTPDGRAHTIVARIVWGVGLAKQSSISSFSQQS